MQEFFLGNLAYLLHKPQQEILMILPNVLRAQEAASYLGIAVSTFWRWVAQGKLPKGIRLGKRCTVWKREELDNYLEQCANIVSQN